MKGVRTSGAIQAIQRDQAALSSRKSMEACTRKSSGSENVPIRRDRFQKLNRNPAPLSSGRT
jgi:hypothetical protein